MKHKKIDKFQILANSVMIVVTLAAILPFILLFMSSITDESAVSYTHLEYAIDKISGYKTGHLFLLNCCDTALYALTAILLLFVTSPLFNLITQKDVYKRQHLLSKPLVKIIHSV